jgi:hypothetical protein
MMMSAQTAVRRLRSIAIVLATLAFVGTAARVAWAGDGAQFSGDCNSTYVNKKVGTNEQWAITWSLFDNVTGNVLKLDGSAPSFIECELQDEDGTNEIFDCWGASACTGPPCSGSQWTQIATNLAVPTSFFLPPGVATDPDSVYAACNLRD